MHRRWQKERLDRSFREDVRDLEAIRDLSSLQLMADMLPERVASPLSLNALREDLEVSHRAVTHWVDILDRTYYAVRVPPFTSKRVRSLRKMPKAHLWDWTLVADRARRLENLVALHLLKLCNLLEDRDGFRLNLYYLRDHTGGARDAGCGSGPDEHQRGQLLKICIAVGVGPETSRIIYNSQDLLVPNELSVAVICELTVE